jgi:parallel beta-helix repeat protein
MRVVRFHPPLITGCAILISAFVQSAAAATLCVNTAGSAGCYSKIQTAVSHASPFDVIRVAHGTYNEDVTIGIPLSLLGAGAGNTVIDASGLANGIYVDGYDNPGLHHVTVSGFTVKNAQYEGVLVVSASDVTVSGNHIVDNDKFGPVFNPVASGCAGQPAFETDENGDCGGGLHLMGVSNSIVSGNQLESNADGILISDETAESHDNLLIHNTVKDNQLECGIVLASHPPVDSAPPYYAPHFGIDHNTVADNISANNGVKVGGAGVGLFSDGNGPGRTSDNVIIRNTLTGNGIAGVALHTHVGPNFGAPADNMDGNQIIGTYIASNLADTGDTATPGRVGININSGGGGSPVWGTVITQNTITDEDVDIAFNTPATVDIHLNDLRGGKIGVANVCAYDHVATCNGAGNAAENYWGCPAGPGWPGCSKTYGANILTTPWLQKPAANEDEGGDNQQ